MMHSSEITTDNQGYYYPIGSMYAIYGNIYHQYTPNVSIYTIHGSYGLRKWVLPKFWINGWLWKDVLLDGWEKANISQDWLTRRCSGFYLLTIYNMYRSKLLDIPWNIPMKYWNWADPLVCCRRMWLVVAAGTPASTWARTTGTGAAWRSGNWWEVSMALWECLECLECFPMSSIYIYSLI